MHMQKSKAAIADLISKLGLKWDQHNTIINGIFPECFPSKMSKNIF